MRILHIGDFHYRSKGNKYDQDEIIQKLEQSLKSKPSIDLIIFSGDLVQSGSDPKDFISAYNSLFLPICTASKVEFSKVILCPGNHDIDRNECSLATLQYFDRELNSNEKIDQEVRVKTKDYISSLAPSNNYNTFIRNIPGTSSDKFSELYSAYIRNIGGKKVGILSINTAWLSSGFRSDEKRLVFPVSLLKEGITHLRENVCDHKLILLHHPISWLTDDNGIELEHIINTEFNIKFSGHIHREDISTRFSGSNGIYSSITQAALAYDKDAQIGYSILEYDLDSFDEEGHQSLDIHRATYQKQDAKFIDLQSISFSIPCGVEKAKQNKLRKKILDKFRSQNLLADELLLDYDNEGSLGFLNTFTSPLLSTKDTTSNSEGSIEHQFDYQELTKSASNYLILGGDKCGKTSLLRWLELNFIKLYSNIGIAPLYIDLKEFNNSAKIDIIKQVSAFYGVNKADAEALLAEGRVIFLLDNWDYNMSYSKSVLDNLKCYSGCSFVVTTEYLASKSYLEELDNLPYNKLYVSNLTRKEIRKYTENIPSLQDITKRDEAIEKITKVCKQLQLPMNYWTISLILLIYRKSNDDYNKNLFGILDLCVDEILQKKKLLFTKNNLTFSQYKKLCAELAYKLLVKHRATVYAAKSVDIINYLNEMIEQNSRLVADPSQVFNYFVEVGLFKEKDGLYTFRLNGIFEYFLAYYINIFPSFKDDILKDDTVYVLFRNEFEIYSGLNSNDENFLKQVFNKTKNVFDDLIHTYITDNDHDRVLISKYTQTDEVTKQLTKLAFTSPLKKEIKDAIEDGHDPLNTQAEVHIKDNITLDKTNPETLEVYLAILSRVFKNIDNVADQSLVDEIFDYIIDAYCTFGYVMIDHLSKQSQSQIEENDEESSFKVGADLLKLMTNIIPVLTQALVYDGIGNINIKKIVEKRIEQYKKDAKNNQYKLYILYFLLMDIDIKNQIGKIDEVFQLIKLSPLKVATFTKLNFYLGFKNLNPATEGFVKKKISESQIRLNDKTDQDDLNRFLTNKDKNKLASKVQQRG